MLHYLAEYITDRIFGDREKEEIKYMKAQFVLESIISETSKLILILLAFWMVGKMFDVLYCICFLALTRRYTGGNHAKTYWGCFVLSMTCFILTIYFSKYLPLVLSDVIYVGWMIFIFFAKRMSSCQHKKSKDKIRKMKAIAFVLPLAIFLRLISLTYLKMGAFILLFQLSGVFRKEVTTNE